jgi:hypothetical protein
MNTMKMICCTLGCLLVLPVLACCDGTRWLAVEDLPRESRTFLEVHFPGIAVDLAVRDGHEIETRLSNGYRVEFKRGGEWKEVDGGRRVIPASILALLPAATREYLAARFPGAGVVKIDKKRNGHEVKLSTGLELTFDARGRLREIDD